MNKKIFLNLKNNIFLYFMGLMYIFLVFTWYFKPPWFIDHLIYLHLATPHNLADLNFWNESGVSVLPGHHNERWAVLVPIMIFEKIFFFINPALSSQVLIFLVFLGILYLLYRIVLINNGRLAANLTAIFFVLAVHHTKNRATEILADPFAVFYLLVAIFIISIFREKLTFRHFFIIGGMLAAAVFTKIHYGIYVILFFVWVFCKNIQWKIAFPPLLLGGAFFIFCLDLVMFFFLDYDIFLQININTINVLIGYIYGGLGVSDGPGNNGWSYEWIKIFAQHNFLPFTFLISSVVVASRGINYASMISWSALSFFILIILLSSLSNFPANDSYAFPIYVLSIPSIAIITSEFKPKEFKNNTYALIISLICILVLFAISQLGAVKNEKIFVSYLSVTILLATIIFCMLLSKKKTKIILTVYIAILFSDIFWHNWKNIENHSWWRNGYNWHYDYLNSIESFNLNDGIYQVHFKDWPRIKNREARELMYIEPGIRSLSRSSIDIYPQVGLGELIVRENTNYILTDYFMKFDEFYLIDSLSFFTKDDNIEHSLFLYTRDE